MEVLDHIDRAEIDRLRAATEFFWLDLMGPTKEQIEEVAGIFQIHPIAVEDMEDFGQRPKLDDYDHFLHIVYYGMESAESIEVHLIVHGDALITVRQDHCTSLMGARKRVADIPPDKEEYAVYRVLDALTDSFFPYLEQLDTTIDQLEETVIGGADAECLQRIVALKRKLGELRRHVGPQRDLLATAGSLFERLPGFTGDGSHDYFRDVYDHLLRINDSIESYRDVLTGLLDVYLSAQSNRLNEYITRLTVLGTIFLPLTFLTGFFGQNFGYLTNHIMSGATFWGLGIGLEVFSVVALYVWFKRQRLPT
ncbi:MAG: magnesium and cobalt transport protein CorA [Solirubrobacteraceae bacterium]|nr:magnesium and cobalt transport protein CorA [Solirubrobacteraceae bacterium]